MGRDFRDPTQSDPRSNVFSWLNPIQLESDFDKNSGVGQKGMGNIASSGNKRWFPSLSMQFHLKLHELPSSSALMSSMKQLTAEAASI